jgi:hypothetical protein
MTQPTLAPAPGTGQPFTLGLTVRAAEVVFGESAFFAVELLNTGKLALGDVTTFDPENHSLRLEAVSGNKRVTGDPYKRFSRELKHLHGPDEPKVAPLRPGEKFTAEGDVIEWIGELEPGDWELRAYYKNGPFPVASDPSPLKVLPPAMVAGLASRPGARAADAPTAMSVVHQLAGAAGYAVFYQQRAASQPALPLHGLRATVVPDVVEAVPSVLAYPRVPAAHVAWSKAGALSVVTVALGRNAPAAARALPLPFRAVVAGSPLSCRDGSLFVPVTDETKTRAGVLAVRAGQAPAFVEAPLDNHGPVGAAAWVWEFEDWLHLVWGKARAREFSHTRLPLADAAGGFTTPAVLPLDEPLLWMDGTVDIAPPPIGPPKEQPEPPHARAFMVTAAEGRLLVHTMDLRVRLAETLCSLDVGKLGAVQVVNSFVTSENHLAMIVQDGHGALHYASSKLKTVRPLEQVVGAPVGPPQQPAVLAGGLTATRPWVYVRYLDKPGGRFRFVLVEPPDEQDPMRDTAGPGALPGAAPRGLQGDQP